MILRFEIPVTEFFCVILQVVKVCVVPQIGYVREQKND